MRHSLALLALAVWPAAAHAQRTHVTVPMHLARGAALDSITTVLAHRGFRVVERNNANGFLRTNRIPVSASGDPHQTVQLVVQARSSAAATLVSLSAVTVGVDDGAPVTDNQRGSAARQAWTLLESVAADLKRGG
jgi:hypothetical protein